MKAAIIVLLLVFTAPAVWAQSGEIWGFVYTENDIPLVKAKVLVSDSANPQHIVKQITTDKGGRYVIQGLPKGSYNITISLDGYETRDAGGIWVNEEKATVWDVKLRKKQP